MPRKKKTNGDNPIGIGLTTKQMKRKKPISNTYLLDIEPITDNQKKLFDSYSEGKHLVAYGTAGTGKTFISLYNAISDIHTCIPVMMTILFNLQYDNDSPWYNFFTTGSSKFRSVYSIIYTAI